MDLLGGGADLMGFEEPKKDNLWEQKNLFNIDNIGKQGIIPEDENTNKSN